MNTISAPPLPPSHGFSLVEIMVAVVIGMISMIVVMQVYGVSEANKRTTTGADDAQISGVIGLFDLQRDLRKSGYGMSAGNLLGCNVTLQAGIVINSLAPVTINHPSLATAGIDANTDTLLIAYGATDGVTEGNAINQQSLVNQNQYAMATPTAFAVNDWVIATPNTRPTPPLSCDLILDKVTAVPVAGAGSTITVQTGVAGLHTGLLYNLGGSNVQGPTVVAYAVRSGNLSKCDYLLNDCSQNVDANWIPIAGNIASLRVQYGRDTNAGLMNGIVDKFDQTTPSSANATYICDWARISAVRLALVARSSQFDKSNPTASAPTWDASLADNPTGSASTPIVLSNTNLPAGTTWQGYRYKVYQAVVPMRNATWMGAPTGC